MHSSYKQINNHEKCTGMGLNGCISKKLNKNYDITKNLGYRLNIDSSLTAIGFFIPHLIREYSISSTIWSWNNRATNTFSQKQNNDAKPKMDSAQFIKMAKKGRIMFH